MAYQLKEGEGTLFKNNNHQENDNRPVYKGRIMVGGTEIELAAWVKTTQKGDKYLSLKGKPAGEYSRSMEQKEQAPSEMPPQAPKPAPAPQAPERKGVDDLPF